MKRLVLSTLLALAACGGGDDDSASPREACDRLAEVVCAKYYECLTEAERDFLQLPPTEAGCISNLKDQYGCEEITPQNVCDGSEVYDPEAADSCLDQLTAVECGDVRDGDIEEDAPSCSETCTIE